MTDNDIIAYDDAIAKIAKKVLRGKSLAMLDDLTQIGRITLWREREKGNARWAYLSRAIERAMIDASIRDAGAVTGSRRQKKRPAYAEIDDGMTAPVGVDVEAAGEAATLYGLIETEITKLPTAQRYGCLRYLRAVESGSRWVTQSQAASTVRAIARRVRSQHQSTSGLRRTQSRP